MKVAKEKVWADEKGNLVADGHEDAAVLVAAKGQTVPDAHLEQYKGGNKFFEDAVFDSDAQHVMPKTIAPAKPEPQTLYNMAEDHGAARVDNRETAPAESPKPKNREADMPKRRTRAAKKKAKK